MPACFRPRPRTTPAAAPRHRPGSSGAPVCAARPRRFPCGHGRGSASLPGLSRMTPFSEVWELTLEHVSRVLIAVGIASSIGVALGILLTRRAGWRRPVLGFASLVHTVPSLALFGFLSPIPLIGGIVRRTPLRRLGLYSP